MILLWKTLVLVGGWGQVHPQKFSFAENLGNIPENPRGNDAQPCLTSEHSAQGLQKITWRPFLEVTPEKVFIMFVGEHL